MSIIRLEESVAYILQQIEFSLVEHALLGLLKIITSIISTQFGLKRASFYFIFTPHGWEH
jgi:hypothetical protein